MTGIVDFLVFKDLGNIFSDPWEIMFRYTNRVGGGLRGSLSLYQVKYELKYSG